MGTRRTLGVVRGWSGVLVAVKTAVIEPAATVLLTPSRGSYVTVMSRVGSCGGVPELVDAFVCAWRSRGSRTLHPCGIPSPWCSPTARRPRTAFDVSGDGPCVTVPRALCGGSEGVDGMPHLFPHLARSRPHWWPAIPPRSSVFVLNAVKVGRKLKCGEGREKPGLRSEMALRSFL